MYGVWPISVPQIDWTTLIREAKEASGVSPVAALNASREDVDGPAALLKAIGSIGDFDLGHVSVSFLMHVTKDEALLMAMRTDLTISASVPIQPDQSVLAVASGNLSVWKDAFRQLCNSERPEGIIELFNRVYWYLEQLDVVKFFGFRKISHRMLFCVE